MAFVRLNKRHVMLCYVSYSDAQYIDMGFLSVCPSVMLWYLNKCTWHQFFHSVVGASF